MDIPLSELGEPVTQLHVFPVPEPFKDAMGRTVGHIIHIDRFGNLITNLRSKDIPREGAAVEIHNQRIDNTAPYYSKSTGLMAIIGGNDYLELSVRNGSAADLLGARVGDTVTVHSRPHS
jgi:S-adenosylmethionine hydrolase